VFLIIFFCLQFVKVNAGLAIRMGLARLAREIDKTPQVAPA